MMRILLPTERCFIHTSAKLPTCLACKPTGFTFLTACLVALQSASATDKDKLDALWRERLKEAEARAALERGQLEASWSAKLQVRQAGRLDGAWARTLALRSTVNCQPLVPACSVQSPA